MSVNVPREHSHTLTLPPLLSLLTIKGINLPFLRNFISHAACLLRVSGTLGRETLLDLPLRRKKSGTIPMISTEGDLL